MFSTFKHAVLLDSSMLLDNRTSLHKSSFIPQSATTVSNANTALTNNLVWTVLRDDKQQSMKHKVLSPNTTVLNIDIQFNAVTIESLQLLPFNQDLEFFYNFNMFLHVKGKECGYKRWTSFKRRKTYF